MSKKSWTKQQNNKKRKKSKTSLSLSFLSAFLSFLSPKFSSQKQTFFAFCCSRRFHFKRTHLILLSLLFTEESARIIARSRDILSVVLCSFNTEECFERKERERERRGERESVVVAFISDWKKKHGWLTNRHLICFFLSPRIASHLISTTDGGIARSRVASWGRAHGVTRIRKKNAGEENDDDAREED